jgi:hypothetical protein
LNNGHTPNQLKKLNESPRPTFLGSPTYLLRTVTFYSCQPYYCLIVLGNFLPQFSSLLYIRYPTSTCFLIKINVLYSITFPFNNTFYSRYSLLIFLPNLTKQLTTALVHPLHTIPYFPPRKPDNRNAISSPPPYSNASHRQVLLGGGTTHEDSPGPLTTDSTSYYPVRTLQCGPLTLALLTHDNNLPCSTQWPPTHHLPTSTSDHPLSNPLMPAAIKQIISYCMQAPNIICAYSTLRPSTVVTTMSLRRLVSHGSSINDVTMASFLETLCTRFNSSFLAPQLIPLVLRDGRNQTRRCIANHSKYRSIVRPFLVGEKAIAIPCFIGGCHWVALARREHNGNTNFPCADDLNDPSTENFIKETISNTDDEFYPPNAIWINCHNFTYSPHSNECGPCTLLALTIMMLHPEPSQNILLPLMHHNLANITRTRVASTIMSGFPLIPPLNYTGHATSQTYSSTVATSIPSYTISSNLPSLLRHTQLSPTCHQYNQLRGIPPPALRYLSTWKNLYPVSKYTLVGGGSERVDQVNTAPDTNLVYPVHTHQQGPLTVAIISLPTYQNAHKWTPTTQLSTTTCKHPLSDLLTADCLQQIIHHCQSAPHLVCSYSALRPITAVTTTWLRHLITHGSPINDETISLFLEVLCTRADMCFLNPQFIPLLLRDGWNQTSKYFVHHNKPRSVFRPCVKGEKVIAIPCFSDTCHWVALVRREYKGHIIFLYADDLNNPSTEFFIRETLSKTDDKFYPPDAHWINCHNFTYHPHSNECGPRTLLALTIMMLHPEPDNTILLPYMHHNLANIARAWVASTILMGYPLIPYLHKLGYTPLPTTKISHSNPSYLIPWHNTPIPLSCLDPGLAQLTDGETYSAVIDPSTACSLSPSSECSAYQEFSYEEASFHSISPHSDESMTQPNLDQHAIQGPSQEFAHSCNSSTNDDTDAGILQYNPFAKTSRRKVKKRKPRAVKTNPYQQRSQLLLTTQARIPSNQTLITSYFPSLATTTDEPNAYPTTLTNSSPTHKTQGTCTVSPSIHVTDSLRPSSAPPNRSTMLSPLNQREEPCMGPITPKKENLDCYYRRTPQLRISSFIPEYVPHTCPTTAPWGHCPESIDTTETLRIILQNPNGLKLQSDIDDFAMGTQICCTLGAGVICLSETNVNWNQSYQVHRVQKIVRDL